MHEALVPSLWGNMRTRLRSSARNRYSPSQWPMLRTGIRKCGLPNIVHELPCWPTVRQKHPKSDDLGLGILGCDGSAMHEVFEFAVPWISPCVESDSYHARDRSKQSNIQVTFGGHASFICLGSARAKCRRITRKSWVVHSAALDALTWHCIMVFLFEFGWLYPGFERPCLHSLPARHPILHAECVG